MHLIFVPAILPVQRPASLPLRHTTPGTPTGRGRARASLCRRSYLRNASLPASPVVTRHKEHQPDVDERGPVQLGHAMESRRQRTINNASWATTSPVLVPPQSAQSEPASGHCPKSRRSPDPVEAAQEQEPASQGTQAGASTPDSILNESSMHLIFMPAILPEQCSASRFARPSSHDTKNTNRTWTSEGQLGHAMESRRQRTINNASWAMTSPVLVPPISEPASGSQLRRE